jgi:glycosyltransferase involved in cell wall biosynthesis
VRVLLLRHGEYPEDPRVRREVRALVDRGHQVDVVCLRGAGVRGAAPPGVRVFRLRMAHRRLGSARYALEYGFFFLAAAVVAGLLHLRRRYDVVQVNTMPDFLVFAAAGPRLAGARVLLDLHEVMPELAASKFGLAMDSPLVRLLAALEQRAIRFADRSLAVSQPCLDRYVARGADQSRFTVVMNAADPALFAPRPRPPRRGPLRVVSHGTLVPRYGFDTLVEAVSVLPDVRLEILGQGEARPDLESLITALGLTDRVRLAGRVPLEDIADRLRKADVGVVANRADPFTDLVVPTKLLELVALGVPAVTARTKAIEAHFDGDTLAWFTPGDSADLARALAGVAADAGAAEAMAGRARELYERRYSWPVMARRYVDLIEGLATGIC